jgi:hypothetical protein
MVCLLRGNGEFQILRGCAGPSKASDGLSCGTGPAYWPRNLSGLSHRNFGSYFARTQVTTACRTLEESVLGPALDDILVTQLVARYRVTYFCGALMQRNYLYDGREAGKRVVAELAC